MDAEVTNTSLHQSAASADLARGGMVSPVFVAEPGIAVLLGQLRLYLALHASPPFFPEMLFFVVLSRKGSST